MVMQPMTRNTRGTLRKWRYTLGDRPPRAVMSTPIKTRVNRPTATLLQHRHTTSVTAVSSSLGMGDIRHRRDW